MQLDAMLRPGKVTAYRFNDDGVTPNHPRWPLLILKRAVRLPRSFDPAAVFEDIFERNGWRDSWRNGVYDYLHYHSRIHEVMGVARGTPPRSVLAERAAGQSSSAPVTLRSCPLAPAINASPPAKPFS
jgi:uncharacterized protein YjlB